MYKTRVNVVTVNCKQTYGDRNNTVFGFSYGELQLEKSCVRCDIFLYIKLFCLCVFFLLYKSAYLWGCACFTFQMMYFKVRHSALDSPLLAPSLVLSLVYNYSFINLSVFFPESAKNFIFPQQVFHFFSFVYVGLFMTI